MKRKWIALILAVALLITMVPLFKGLALAAWCHPDPTYELHVTGKKEWEGDEGDERPDSVTLKLVDADGTIVKDDIEVSKAGNWEFDFSVNVNEIETPYTLEEIDVPENYESDLATFNVTAALHCNYEKSASQPGANSFYKLGNDPNLIVIFKHAGGHYIWKATAWTSAEEAAFDGNAYNNPTFISGTQSRTNFSFNGGSYRFSVSKKGSGYEIDFEKKTWGWYSANHAIEKGSISCNTKYSASNVKLTNTYTPPTTICGVKTWEDNENQDGIRPEKITVILWEKVDQGGGSLLTAEIEVDRLTVYETDNWNYNFGDRPLKKNGNNVTYYIEEEAVEGYTPTYDGYNITNKHVPEETSITVKKVWEGGVPGTSYPSVTVILYKRVGDDPELKKAGEVTLEDDSWTHTFENLFVKEGGEKITYSISEVDVPGYKSEIAGNPEEGFTITNTYTPPPTTVPTNTQPETTTTEETTEVPATEPTTSEIVAGDEDEKTTTTITQPTEVVAGDEDEVDVVPTGENYLYFVVAILFILSGAVVLVPAIKKVRVKK